MAADGELPTLRAEIEQLIAALEVEARTHSAVIA